MIERLIVVHGVGSFGHPPVVEHKLHKGFHTPDQLIHLTDAQNRVMELRMAVAQACHQAGLPVATIMPSSCMTADGFVRQEMFLGDRRLSPPGRTIPLLGGDVLVDRRTGFSVHSGDAIAVEAGVAFRQARLVFATAVDGIYDRDPRKIRRPCDWRSFPWERPRPARRSWRGRRASMPAAPWPASWTRCAGPSLPWTRGCVWTSSPCSRRGIWLRCYGARMWARG
ncbi:MAG: hypothetical protein R3A10_19385 [Caldilineaceae bacterium]